MRLLPRWKVEDDPSRSPREGESRVRPGPFCADRELVELQVTVLYYLQLRKYFAKITDTIVSISQPFRSSACEKRG